MIVIATHLNCAGASVSVYSQLHHSSRLLKLALILKLIRFKNRSAACGPDDIRVQFRIQRRGITKPVTEIS